MIVVPGCGRKPNNVLLCGEKVGQEEANKGRPFAGRSGEEQRWYLELHHLNPNNWYLTNLRQHFVEGNPDPTPEEIAYWTPRLIREIEECQPKLIIAAGRYAIKWFLGEDAELDMCNGLPHRPGCFDPSRANRVPKDCVILPIYHPAAGFYQAKTRTEIAKNYAAVANTIKLINAGLPVRYREDEYLGQEEYYDVTGEELEEGMINWLNYPVNGPHELAIDTEGTPDNPWSIQVSTTPGTAMTLRCSQPDFSRGIEALQRVIDTGCLVITHCAQTPQGAMYDMIMARAMGLNLSRARVWDTMYALYLLRTEPKGLKPASWRWCGARQDPYQELLGDLAKQKQISYLERAIDRNYPRVPARIIRNNDGTTERYQPQAAHTTITRLLSDIYNNKVTKDGPVDPYDRWKKLDSEVRKQVESIHGPIPIATLDDVELEKAVRYACRDADLTLRLKLKLEPELRNLGLL